MEKSPLDPKCVIGMVGMGVMGRNLALNIADHGYAVAGYDRDQSKIDAFRKESGIHHSEGSTNIVDFIALLRKPRSIMVMVPAGGPVDSVIKDLLPHLEPGDLIIDAGNSHFKDTDLRLQSLAVHSIDFLGVGVSGGELGARFGPSLMPGGSKESYERVRPIFEAVAAHVDNVPCVTYLGPGSSGHYVKMVHNGIEYGIMQLIAEAYDLLKRGYGLSDEAIGEMYGAWNKGSLNGYLIEITSRIFSKKDPKNGRRLIDEVLDVASQTGTGLWTSSSAMELQVPIPTIDLAVAMRDLSVLVHDRANAGEIYLRPINPIKGHAEKFIGQLEEALFTAIIMTYAQGFALLAVASLKYKYQLDLESVSQIWRGGCIIRSEFLVDCCTAFRGKRNLSNILLAPNIALKVRKHQENLRQVIGIAAELGVPVPGLMVSLGYFDAYRSAWLPANLIQAQRDCFGAHSYQRVDGPGTFHSQWMEGSTS